jgi:hypothetical protein
MDQPCPTCSTAMALGPPPSRFWTCRLCGFSSEKKKAGAPPRLPHITEVFPLEGRGLALSLFSGAQLVFRLGPKCLVQEGAIDLSASEIASERLKVLPRMGGGWIVLDLWQPLTRGVLDLCADLGDACRALWKWVDRERAGGIALRAPLPKKPMVPAAQTMTEVAAREVKELRLPRVKPKPGEKKPPLLTQSRRTWPGCGHRKFAREKICRFCVAQVRMLPEETVEKTRPQAKPETVAEETWGEWIAAVRARLGHPPLALRKKPQGPRPGES